jgi:DNA-binding NtrC family response regulator
MHPSALVLVRIPRPPEHRRLSVDPRILVIDDAPHMLRLLCRILGEALGAEAEVHAQADGRVALAAVSARRFDLVITDLRLPGASGLDVLREAKRQRPESEVLLVTALASAEDLREAARLGAFGCVEKPFDPDELTSLIRAALGRAVMPRGHRAAAAVLPVPSLGVNHGSQ